MSCLAAKPLSSSCRRLTSRRLHRILGAGFWLAALSGACTATGQPVDIKFDRFEQWPGYPRAAAIQRIGQDETGFLWLTTPRGSMRFDGNVFEWFPEKPPVEAMRSQAVTGQLADHPGHVWTVDKAHLHRTGQNTPAGIYPLPSGSGPGRAVFFHPEVSGDSIIWILADSALLCFHKSRGRFIREYRNRGHDAQSLYGAPFRCAFLSAEGILWLGGESGLCKYDWRNQEFRLYHLDPGNPSKGGELNFVQGVAGDPSRCWVTTNDMGLLQYDLYGHRLLPDAIQGELKRLSDRNTYSLACDKLGRLWVGNTDDSIFVCDVQRGEIVRRIPLNGDMIHFILKDMTLGHFWRLYKPSGNNPGIIRINQETLQSDTFRVPYWQNQPFGNRIDYFAPPRNDTSWFIHNAGFIQFYHAASSRSGQKPIHAFSGITPDMSKYYNLRYDPVGNTLWLMTADALYKLDWGRQTAKKYPAPRHEPGQTNMRIHTDNLGRVWMQCIPKNILYKFDPVRETFARYDWSDGLPAAAVECVDVDRVGKKWCQRYHDYSFLLFDPGNVPVVPVNRPVITGIYPLNQKAASIQPFLPSKTTRSNLQIAFTAVSFGQGRHLQFKYRLIGIDTAWVSAGAERVAVYNNLQPGIYRFQVMAANREGDWRPEPAEISFEVQPPLFMQTWFWISLSLLIAGLFYLGLRFWEKRRIARFQLRRRIAEDLQREVELALNNISVLSVNKRPNTADNDLLERIEHNSKTAAEKLSDLVWFLNPDNDSTAETVRRICDYTRNQLALWGIIPIIRIEESVYHLNISTENRKALYLRYKYTFNELIRQNDCTKTEINISKDGARLIIKIHLGSPPADNGPDLKSSSATITSDLSTTKPF